MRPRTTPGKRERTTQPDSDRGDRLYRFGFVCHRAQEPPAGDAVWAEIAGSWERVELDGLVVLRHPETPIRVRSAPGGTAAIVGEAYSLVPGSDLDSALDALLAAAGDAALFEAVDRLGGRFALILLGPGGRRLFHDPIGSRSVYYRSGAELGFGSHAELLASAFGDARHGGVQDLLRSDEYRSRTVSYLPGDLTLYDGIYGLAPNNYYDLEARRTVRYWPRDERRKRGFDEFFALLDEGFDALGSHLAGGFDPVLGITGGIDTRTIAAAFRAHGRPFRGLTWLRRRGGAGPRERELIAALVRRLEVEHTTLDLDPLDNGRRAVAALARQNAGGFSAPSRIVGQMHDRFGPRAAFVRGYGAEIIRGFYNLAPGHSAAAGPVRGGLAAAARGLRLVPSARRVAVRAATPADLLRAYSSSMREQGQGRAYTRFGLEAFEGFIERASFDQRLERSGFDLSDLFYWEHRMGMWGAAKHNEMDTAALSLAGFNSRAAYQAAFGLSRRQRLSKELLREVIRRYDRELAEIPYV